ncbi:MAG: fluoride efflux transporter CrcB [Candidatus Omnitrophica bacterium]|nr:fluoride efflux transporter CrcB [Candidatus Omnitrophota bacterium]
MKWLCLAFGGALGTISRYALSGVVYRVLGTQFPLGTLTVNLLGCFLIGFLAVVSEEKFFLNPHTRVLLMVGFCGAFTTFSTFIFETAHLMRDGETLRAFVNVMASVILGFLVFRTGILIGELI